MKIIKRILLIIIITVLAIVGVIIYKLKSSEGVEFIVEPVNLSEVRDGVYTGESNNIVIFAKVEVTVKDNHIIAINILEHRHGRGEKGEEVVKNIIQAQSVVTDDISGATYSSKTIRKAVETALNQAIANQ